MQALQELKDLAQQAAELEAQSSLSEKEKETLSDLKIKLTQGLVNLSSISKSARFGTQIIGLTVSLLQ